MNEAARHAFRAWLGTSTELGSRSVNDVVSRLRRVARMIDLSEVGSETDLTIRLLGSEAFRACSGPVRSQLKRAASLYLEFQAQQGDRVQ